MTCVARVRRIAAEPMETSPRTCCTRIRRVIPYVYQPETTAYLEYVDMNIPEDDTVYFPGTAYEITGAEIWLAVDNFFVAVKYIFGLTLFVNNLSTIFKFLYIRFGGTATMHKVNSILPGTFEGTFYGGWTHDGSGALGNGTNTYFDTNCQADLHFNSNDLSFHIDIKTNSDGSMIELDSRDGVRGDIYIRPKNAGNLTTGLSGTNTQQTVANANSLSMFSINRVVSTEYKTYKEGVLLNTHILNSNPNMSNIKIFEASIAGATSSFSSRKRTLLAGGFGMTDAEVLAFKNAWRVFEAALNR